MKTMVLQWLAVSLLIVSCSSPTTPNNPYADLTGNNRGGGGNLGNAAGLTAQPPGSWKNLGNGFSRLRLSGDLVINGSLKSVYPGQLAGAKLAVVGKNPLTRLGVMDVLISNGIAYVVASTALLAGPQAYSVRIDHVTYLEEISIGGAGPLGSGILPTGWRWFFDETQKWVVILDNPYFT